MASARLAASVTRTLQGYADRGIFLGFAVTPAARSTVRYRFRWLTRRPMDLRFDPAARRLVFHELFPNATKYPGVTEAMRATVASASSLERPRHRRVDPRRAKMACRFVRGHGSLQLSIETTSGDYPVRAALGLVNELFLVLHECFPEYLIAEFGASPE